MGLDLVSADLSEQPDNVCFRGQNSVVRFSDPTAAFDPNRTWI